MNLIRRILKDTYYFFPVQLLLENLRRNHTLIFFWVLLFFYITKAVGYKYGIYALFLAPEYLGRVNFISYLILGFTMGVFTMAYHIATYMIHGNRFPALASFSHPFFRFSLNNFFLPVGFLITYFVVSIRFQIFNQLFSSSNVFFNILFFVVGMSLFYLLTFGYFSLMNRGFENLLSLSTGKLGKWKITRPVQKALERDALWKKGTTPRHNVGITRIGLYLSRPFKIKRAPMRLRMKPNEIQSRLRQNHTFATVFSLIILIGLLLVGSLINQPAFNIPAASSVFLIFTIALLIYAVFHTLFKEYALWIFLGIFVMVIYILNEGIILKEGRAYGMNYNITEKNMDEVSFPSVQEMNKDRIKTLQILNSWKKNVSKDGIKPKMVVVNTSGGGLKAALWTYRVLSYTDSLLNGSLFPHVKLITGASGGMVGAAYLRELNLRKQQHKIALLKNDSLLTNLAKDMLNQVALYLALKDWFINFSSYTYNGYSYRKDRGWALENKLNFNTGSILDKPLISYKEPEEQSVIPMMFLSPTILNDGRLLLISPLNTRYMMQPPDPGGPSSFLAFRETYQAFDANHLRFTSALRMNASFPFISPVVTLPGVSKLKITDAGFRDNFGGVTSLRFLYIFSDWISKNTSGVVFISITQQKKPEMRNSSAFDFLRPVEGIYRDYFQIQQLNQQNMFEFAQENLGVPMDVIHLDLNEMNERISLSWHLTNREKEHIKASVYSSENQKEIKRLGSLLGKEE